jgi:hypothetical protein
MLLAAVIASMAIPGSVTPAAESPSPAFILTGNGLLKWCEKYDPTASGPNAAACAAYIAGVVESLDNYEGGFRRMAEAEQRIAAAEKRQPRHSGMVAMICIPDNSTYDQHLRVVIKYLRDHPERLHEPRLRVTLSALFAAFPCGGRAVP